MNKDNTSNRAAADAGDVPALVEDILPYFIDKSFVYVDVGAHRGAVFAALCASDLRMREAHLIEPNPSTFAMLKQEHEGTSNVRQLHFHNLAVGREPGELDLRDDGELTRVIREAGALVETDQSGATFKANAVTLDSFAGSYDIKHISLLKVDVEGFELEVLDGAERLLSSDAIDMVYVEAGIDPDNDQQTYYRSIEDKLGKHKYKLFRIYDQVHETFEDKPTLRRVNLAFMSRKFANENPARSTRRRYKYRAVARALKEEVAAKETELTALTTENEDLQRRLAEAEQRFAADVSRLAKSLASKDGETSGGDSDGRGTVLAEQTAAKVLQLQDLHADEVARLEEELTHRGSRLRTLFEDRKKLRVKRKELRQELAVLRSSHKLLQKENARLSMKLAAITSSRTWRFGSALFGGRHLRELAKPDAAGPGRVGSGDAQARSVSGRGAKVEKRPEKAASSVSS